LNTAQDVYANAVDDGQQDNTPVILGLSITVGLLILVVALGIGVARRCLRDDAEIDPSKLKNLGTHELESEGVEPTPVVSSKIYTVKPLESKLAGHMSNDAFTDAWYDSSDVFTDRTSEQQLGYNACAIGDDGAPSDFDAGSSVDLPDLECFMDLDCDPSCDGIDI
jgi:hypothetical protein